MSAADTLKRLQILSDWTDDELELLALRMEEVEVAGGTALLTEGENAQAAFILRSGRLRILSRGEILGAVDTVACFGEISCLLPDTPVTATVMAESDTVVYRISREDLLATVDQVPKLWRALFAQMTGRLKRANKRLAEILDHSPQGFLKLDRDACVTNEYSRKCLEYLGRSPLSGVSFPELLTPGDLEGAASWKSVFSMVFDDVGVPLSDLFDLLTPEARIEAGGVLRDLRIEFHPIFEDDGTVSAVDVGIEDITRERELERARELERGRQATLGKVYHNPDSFFTLLRLIDDVESSGTTLLAGLRDAGFEACRHDVARLMRDLHSLKGLAGNFGLGALRRAAHELETALGLMDDPDTAVAGPAAVDELTAKARETLAQNGIGTQVARDLNALMRFAGDFGLTELQQAARQLEVALESISRGGGHAAAPVDRLDHAFAQLLEAMAEGRSLREMIDPSLLQRLEGVVLVPDQFEAMRSALEAGDLESAEAILLAAESVDIKQLFACWPTDIDRLGAALGKDARLELFGVGGMVPKPVFMALDRVLVHALNNAMDHGLEDPETRLCADKDTQGVIAVMVEVGADSAFIEIADDGRGIDADTLIEKARQNAALDQALVESCVDAGEAWRVLLMPGFSTAQALSETSGRGVGLDAVDAAVRALGGQLVIDSTPGQGLALRITVPLAAPPAEPLEEV